MKKVYCGIALFSLFMILSSSIVFAQRNTLRSKWIRPKHAILHRDTVLFQGVFYHYGGFRLITPNYELDEPTIVRPFKIDGKSYMRQLEKSYALPKSVIPDSTLLIVTWWNDSTRDTASRKIQVTSMTDEIAILNGDPNQFRERFHRPSGAILRFDTVLFSGFFPESEKFPPRLLYKYQTSIGEFRKAGSTIRPPFNIDGKVSYHLIARGSEDLPGLVKAMSTNSCPLCPPGLIADSTKIAMTLWRGSNDKDPVDWNVDEIWILK